MSGPIFVSIGDAEKLNVFLDANPHIPRSSAFVDDYSFDAYKAVGFGRFDEVDPEVAKSAKLTAPELGGFGDWWKYFSAVGNLSPVPKDMKFGEFPEGVLRTGGTFVVNGNDVIYQWTDEIPGNHPNVEEVVQTAKDSMSVASKEKKGWF